MKRRSFTHEYSYRGYFHITINTADYLRQPLGRVCGHVEAADDEAGAPYVELTPIGQMVQDELLGSITRHYPMVEVDEYVIMPEHLHILLHATRDIFSSNGRRTHVGRVIAGFKQGCNRRYWEMTGRISTATAMGTAEQEGSLATKSPGTIAANQVAGSTTAGRETGGTTAGRGEGTAAQEAGSTTAVKETSAAAAHVAGSGAAGRGEGATAGRETEAAAASIDRARALNDSVVEHHHPSPASPLPPLFEAGYCDVIPIDDRQLTTQRAYIRNNPRSRLLRTSNRASLMTHRGGIDTAVTPSAMCGYLRRVCPAHLFTPAIWQELEVRFLMEDSHIRCDSFGNRELLQRHLRPVICHRKDAALFSFQKAQCLKAAESGEVLVSARIAPGEQEIMDAVLTSGFPVIHIEDNGFSDHYHPSADKLDACAVGQLLIVTPWHYLFRRKDETIQVPFCKAMNCLAQALSRTKDDWWKKGGALP